MFRVVGRRDLIDRPCLLVIRQNDAGRGLESSESSLGFASVSVATIGFDAFD
jgi:hypothetical protein